MKDYKFIYENKDKKVFMECENDSPYWALAQMMKGRIVYQPPLNLYYEYQDKDKYPIKEIDKDRKLINEISVENFIGRSQLISKKFEILSYARFSLSKWIQSKITKEYFYIDMVNTIDNTYGIRAAGKDEEFVLDFKTIHLDYKRARIVPDFSNVDEDSDVFLYGHGMVKVWVIKYNQPFSITVVVNDRCGDERLISYTKDGKINNDKYSTLFESKEQAMAYYAEISKDIDGRIEYNEN